MEKKKHGMEVLLYAFWGEIFTPKRDYETLLKRVMGICYEHLLIIWLPFSLTYFNFHSDILFSPMTQG